MRSITVWRDGYEDTITEADVAEDDAQPRALATAVADDDPWAHGSWAMDGRWLPATQVVEPSPF